MKRCLTLLLVLVLVTLLTGCSGKETSREADVKNETEIGMSNDNIGGSFMEVVTGVSENGILAEHETEQPVTLADALEMEYSNFSQDIYDMIAHIPMNYDMLQQKLQ